jgi:S-layer homology domain
MNKICLEIVKIAIASAALIATAEFGGMGAIAQITPVSQLSDVQPTDWAFEALRSLVEKYSCLTGYPDNTYRGNRGLTRYEFATTKSKPIHKIAYHAGENVLASLKRWIPTSQTG